MDKSQMKIFGIGCIVVSLICLFIAFERSSTNSNNVKAINAMTQSMPFSGMMGNRNLEAATPATSKYALLFAALSAIGGVVLLAKSASNESTRNSN